MFRGRRAWFSQSVSPGLQELWEAEGGALARRRDADFLFSSDAAHADTRRIHESLDYLHEIRRKIGNFIWEQMDDFLAKQPQYSESLLQEPETGSEQQAEDALEPSESSEEKTDSTTQGEFSYHALQEYPVNNMVTGYASARDMKKYVGELRDFIPGTSGYTAYWIQSEINLYSDVKNKLKRK